MENKTEKILVLDYEYNHINAWEATKVWCACTHDLSTGEKRRFTPKEEGPDHYHVEWQEEFLEYVKGFDKYVAHNLFGAEYIISEMLLGWTMDVDKCIDTIVYSRLLRPVSPPTERLGEFKKNGWDNRVGGHSLAAWGKRLGNFKMAFDDFDQFTFKQADYCAQDVDVNVQMYHVLMKEKEEFGFPDEPFWLESWAAHILNQQRIHGFRLHKERAKKLVLETDALIEEYTAKLHEIFPPQKKLVEVYKPSFITEKDPKTKKTIKDLDGTPVYTNEMTGQSKKKLLNWMHEENQQDGTYNLYVIEEFNPGSYQQVGERLMQIGWEPRKFTPTGKPSTAKDVIGDAIEELADRYPQVEVLRKYNIVTHRNGIAREWLELAEGDGRVHGSMFHIGPWTHRSSHFKPNMGNVASVQLDKEGHPIEGLEGNFGWDCRHCWIPREGWELVGCDASGIQLRALAHYMNDPDYIKEVTTGDVHVANQLAAAISDRPTAKTFIYCVPKDTTLVLTKEGWKPFDQIEEGKDFTVGYNLKTGKSEWTLIDKVLDSGENEVISYTNSSIQKIECTENHKWVSYKRKRDRDNKRPFSYEEYFSISSARHSDYKIITSAPVEVTSTFNLTNQELKVLTWLLTDGYIKWSGKKRNSEMGVLATIVQSPRKFLNEVIELTEDCCKGVYQNRHNDCSVVYIKPSFVRSLWNKLDIPYGIGKHEVDWSKFILQMSKDQLELFMDVFVKAEGWKTDNTFTVAQNEGPILEAVELCAYLLGYRPSVKVRQENHKCVRLIKNTTILPNYLKEVERRKTSTFCLSTELGSFTIRQGDFISLTGNCWLLGGGDEKIGTIVGLQEGDEERLFKEASQTYKFNFFGKHKQRSNGKPKIDPKVDNLLNYTCDKLRNEGRTATKKTVATILKGHYTKKKFLENLPALREFKNKVIPQAAKQGFMVGLDGRKIWVPSEHLAMGAYLQGFESVIMKRAMVMYYQKLTSMGIPFRQVNYVHDELAVECPPEHSELVGKTIQESIIEAGEYYNSNCPLAAEYLIGESWAKTH